MDHLYRLKDTLTGFLSPKRRRTVGPNTPTKQLAEEHAFLPASEPSKKAQAALHERISRKHAPTADTRFGPGSRKRPREDDDPEIIERMDSGDTEIDIDEEVSPHESASQITPVEGSATGSVDLEDEDEAETETQDAEPELSPDEKVKAYLARQAMLLEKMEEVKKVTAVGDWHEDEIDLFEKLSMRGYQAIIAKSWEEYLRTWPEDLFTPTNDAFLAHNKESDYANIKALERLTTLGWRLNESSCAYRMHVYFKSYIKWCEKDGGYYNKRYIPVIALLAASPSQSTARIIQNLARQMSFLAEKHRENLLLPSPFTNETGQVEMYRRRPPLIYGLLISKSSVIVVTLDSAHADGTVRHIAVFDFLNRAEAMWNGLAVAIVCNAAKRSVMPYTEELEDESEEEDVDL